ncbi:MAG: hypothetical protein ACK53Y_26135, partial [bacterium]
TFVIHLWLGASKRASPHNLCRFGMPMRWEGRGNRGEAAEASKCRDLANDLIGYTPASPSLHRRAPRAPLQFRPTRTAMGLPLNRRPSHSIESPRTDQHVGLLSFIFGWVHQSEPVHTTFADSECPCDGKAGGIEGRQRKPRSAEI